jgi:hypothetical protein
MIPSYLKLFLDKPKVKSIYNESYIGFFKNESGMIIHNKEIMESSPSIKTEAKVLR